MEKIINLDLNAKENIIIASKEELVALELKKLAKNLLKRVKTRKNFAEKEIKLAEIRKSMVDNNYKLLENKINSREILDFSEDVIKKEREFIDYHEKIAENQLNLAKLHKEIAELEEKLAKSKIILANSKLNVAKTRLKIGKLQQKFVNVVQKKTPEKAKIIKHLYKEEEEKLNHQLKDVIEKENQVKMLQNDIAKITNKLSQTLTN